MRVDNTGAVHLIDEDEVIGPDAHGASDSFAILGDVNRIVANVQAEVERLVGTYAHPAEAVGHERFDTPLAKGLGAVDSKKTALFAVKLQWDWHVGQIPLSSSTWRRSR